MENTSDTKHITQIQNDVVTNPDTCQTDGTNYLKKRVVEWIINCFEQVKSAVE